MQVTKQILLGSAENDRRALKVLYEYCYRQFIRLCMRYYSNHEDARHALNNGFLKIVNGLQNVDLDELNFGAWAKRIIVNTLIDEYRKNKNHNQLIVSKETEGELAYAAEKVENLGALELSYQEIAEQLNEPLSNVKVKLLRAKKLLAEIIQQR